jgi:hypothetical protein
MLRAAVAHHHGQSQCETVVALCAYFMLHAKSFHCLYIAPLRFPLSINLGVPPAPAVAERNTFHIREPSEQCNSYLVCPQEALSPLCLCSAPSRALRAPYARLCFPVAGWLQHLASRVHLTDYHKDSRTAYVYHCPSVGSLSKAKGKRRYRPSGRKQVSVCCKQRAAGEGGILRHG